MSPFLTPWGEFKELSLLEIKHFFQYFWQIFTGFYWCKYVFSWMEKFFCFFVIRMHFFRKSLFHCQKKLLAQLFVAIFVIFIIFFFWIVFINAFLFLIVYLAIFAVHNQKVIFVLVVLHVFSMIVTVHAIRQLLVKTKAKNY